VQFDFENNERLRVKIKIERRSKKERYGKEKNQIKETKNKRRGRKRSFQILKDFSKLN